MEGTALAHDTLRWCEARGPVCGEAAAEGRWCDGRVRGGRGDLEERGAGIGHDHATTLHDLDLPTRHLPVRAPAADPPVQGLREDSAGDGPLLLWLRLRPPREVPNGPRDVWDGALGRWGQGDPRDVVEEVDRMALEGVDGFVELPACMGRL